MKWREELSDGTFVDFDDCSQEYIELLNASIRLSGEKASYFDIYKLNCVKRWACRPQRLSMTLDFGCGIGRLSNLLARTYPRSKVYGYDISLRSIKLAREKWGHLKNLVFDSRLPDAGLCDLITAANVFHHIRREDRRKILIQLRTLLKPDGTIALFEHNPFNPLTLHVVKNCPFDADANLISLGQFVKLALDSGLKVYRKRYIVFFPKPLQFLRKLEPFLGFLPLGAQYMLILKRDQQKVHPR